MKILLCCLVMILASFIDAYTIVLKSGRKIEGHFLTEDEKTIQIKGADGLTISCRKNQLDLDAMKLENEVKPPPKANLPRQNKLPETKMQMLKLQPWPVTPPWRNPAFQRAYTATSSLYDQHHLNSDKTQPDVNTQRLPSAPERSPQPTANIAQDYSVQYPPTTSWVDAEIARYEAAEAELNRLRINKQIAASECLIVYTEMGGGSVWTSDGFYPYSYSGQGAVYSPGACELARQFDEQLQEAQEYFRRQGVPWKYLE